MGMIAYALIWIAGIAGAVYLGMNEHPVLAFIILFAIASISIETNKGDD